MYSLILLFKVTNIFAFAFCEKILDFFTFTKECYHSCHISVCHLKTTKLFTSDCFIYDK